MVKNVGIHYEIRKLNTIKWILLGSRVQKLYRYTRIYGLKHSEINFNCIYIFKIKLNHVPV